MTSMHQDPFTSSFQTIPQKANNASYYHQGLVLVVALAVGGEVSAHQVDEDNLTKWHGSSPAASLSTPRGRLIVDQRVNSAQHEQVSEAAQILEYVLKNSKLAVSELARTMGVSRQAVYNWRNGEGSADDKLVGLRALRTAVQILKENGLPASGSNLRRTIGGTSVLKELSSNGDVSAATERLVAALSREAEQLANSHTRTAEVRERVARQGGSAELASTIGRPVDDG